MSAVRPRRAAIHLVEVPLRAPFRHAAHERRASLNLVVGLQGETGAWGWGEGVPREYVTGESAQGCFAAALEAARAFAWPTIETPEQVAPALEQVADALLPQAPSARCAFELALVDLAGQTFGMAARDVVARLAQRLQLPLRPPTAPVIHSGVIGEGSLGAVTVKALKMRLFGLREIKIKVGSDARADRARVRRLRRVLGPRADLRVDANGAWTPGQAEAAIAALAPFRLSSVEQPLARGREEELPGLRRAVRVPIALDESLCSLEDARRAVAQGWCDLFNLRLSKCGGMVSALRIYAEARRAGLGAWLGCMVGETPLLSAAGRAFAAAVDGLRHVEGAYDRHLLAALPFGPAVGFGRGGRGAALPGPGLGVGPTPMLKELTRRCTLCDLS